jgi:hypothetical protein
VVVAIGAIFGVGFFVGGVAATERVARADATRERERERATEAVIWTCKDSLAKEQVASWERDRRNDRCQAELADCRSTDLGLIPACTPTSCTDGDPLCNRNLMRSFDSFFNTSDKVHDVERAIGRCLTRQRPVGLRVLVALAPEEHFGSNAPLSTEETKCAVHTLHDMHMETFDGIRRSNPMNWPY